MLVRTRGNTIKASYQVLVESALLDPPDYLKFLNDVGTFEKVYYADPYAPNPVVTPVYLNIQKPLHVSDIDDALLDRVSAIAGKGDETVEAMRFARRSGDPETITSLTPGFRSALRELGYDGICDIGGRITGGDEHTVWIALEASQIMSALDPMVLSATAPDHRHDTAATRKIEQDALSRLEDWRASRDKQEPGPAV
jgi:hypothetical protein